MFGNPSAEVSESGLLQVREDTCSLNSPHSLPFTMAVPSLGLFSLWLHPFLSPSLSSNTLRFLFPLAWSQSICSELKHFLLEGERRHTRPKKVRKFTWPLPKVLWVGTAVGGNDTFMVLPASWADRTQGMQLAQVVAEPGVALHWLGCRGLSHVPISNPNKLLLLMSLHYHCLILMGRACRSYGWLLNWTVGKGRQAWYVETRRRSRVGEAVLEQDQSKWEAGSQESAHSRGVNTVTMVDFKLPAGSHPMQSFEEIHSSKSWHNTSITHSQPDTCIYPCSRWCTLKTTKDDSQMWPFSVIYDSNWSMHHRST